MVSRWGPEEIGSRSSGKAGPAPLIYLSLLWARATRIKRAVLVLPPVLVAGVAAALAISLGGSGDSDPTPGAATTEPYSAAQDTTPPGDLPTVTNVGFSDVWNSGGAGLTGARVRIAARVYQDTGDSILAYADPAQDELPVQVFSPSSVAGENDYVLISGTLTGSDSYKTVGGGQVDVITIAGDKVAVITEARANEIANPPVGGKKKLNLTQTQAGLTVTLKSVSWTEKATRLDIEITNGGTASASLLTFDAKIQQGARQFSLDDQASGSSALSDDIKAGVTEKGTLTFKRISRKRGAAYVSFDWTSNNYDIDTSRPFEFTMSW
ncbi:MAG: hypothetical protein QOE06_3520 [Thermoleophilaceae bacterium]|nr:hypothetical protein [Thermoleophilaceae bacterium]